MSTPDVTKDANRIDTSPGGEHAWKRREGGDEIPCPALLCFYNHGLLKPDGEGYVTIDELDKVLTMVGVNATVRNILTKAAENSDGARDGKFNLFKLRDSRVDHPGSTGVRDPKVRPEKLESNLLSFGENQRMYAEHFAAAAAHCSKEDPGIRGTLVQTVELTALLEVFGRVDESNRLYLTNEDVRGLWLDGRFPADWQPRPADELGAGTIFKGVSGMLLKRAMNAVGL